MTRNELGLCGRTLVEFAEQYALERHVAQDDCRLNFGLVSERGERYEQKVRGGTAPNARALQVQPVRVDAAVDIYVRSRSASSRSISAVYPSRLGIAALLPLLPLSLSNCWPSIFGNYPVAVDCRPSLW